MQTRPQDAHWLKEHEALWKLVRRWPGLRGEDKLAWDQLSQLTRCGREKVLVTGSMLADWQGTTSDAGLTRLKNLASKGFIESVPWNQQLGQYLVTLLDPRDLAEARKVKIVWDGQLAFPFATDGLNQELGKSDGETTSGAGIASPVEPGSPGVIRFPRQQDAPPRAAIAPPEAALVRDQSAGASSGGSAAGSEEAPALPRSANLTLRELNAHPHLKLQELEDLSGRSLSQEVGRDRGSAGPSGASSAVQPGASALRLMEVPLEKDPQIAALAATVAQRQAEAERQAQAKERHQDATVARVGDAMAARVAQHDQAATPAAKMARVDQLVGTIMQRVACPKMIRGAAVRIAWAIVEDEMPAARLYECLESLASAARDQRITGTRSQYFNASIGRYLPPRKAPPTKPR